MQSDAVVYTKEHVELLVKLAFIKGQEFAKAQMLKEATKRVALILGDDHDYKESEAVKDNTTVEKET